MDGSSQISQSTILCCASLNNFSHGGEHGQTSVGSLLGFKLGPTSWVLGPREWVESKVTRSTLSRFPSKSGGNTREGLNEHNKNESGRNVLWVGIPELPESINLVLGCRHFISWSRSEDFHLEETDNCQHGQAAMLDLGLTKPVKINAQFVNVGKTKWVKANIAWQRTVKLQIHCTQR